MISYKEVSHLTNSERKARKKTVIMLREEKLLRSFSLKVRELKVIICLPQAQMKY